MATATDSMPGQSKLTANGTISPPPVDKGFADAMLLTKQTSAPQIWVTSLQDLRSSHFDAAGAQVRHTHCPATRC